LRKKILRTGLRVLLAVFHFLKEKKPTRAELGNEKLRLQEALSASRELGDIVELNIGGEQIVHIGRHLLAQVEGSMLEVGYQCSFVFCFCRRPLWLLCSF
jgi:hypothetical protein